LQLVLSQKVLGLPDNCKTLFKKEA